MSLKNDGFETGRRGGSVFNTKDTLGWAAGDLARKNEEAFNGEAAGEEHPNAWAIFILVGAVGAVTGLLLERGLMPSFLTVAGWRVVVAWLGSAATIYFGLKAMPGWLSGALMGILLGGAAGYAGWIYLSPLWAAGLGIGVGSLMYLCYSMLE